MDSQPVEDPIEMAIDSPGRKTLVLGESDSDCDTGFDPQPIPAPAPPSPKPSSLLGKVKNKILEKRASSPKIKAEPLDKSKEAKTEEGEEHSKPCPDSQYRDELA
ncbi:unnamed protein product [Cladocopium goreaui]|uniref:Uncharacterized protein n=1 Tax=Cladocopium goreaui TaxID=2562237 RepID=A0A9P1G7S0_9DINO|nr:unnamed protein product [Cladocopium goreaui]